MESSHCGWRLGTWKPIGEMCGKRGSCCSRRRRTFKPQDTEEHGENQKACLSMAHRSSKHYRHELRYVVLQQVKPVAQPEENNFQSGKDHKKAVVNAKEQAVVEAPFIGGQARLHGAVKTAGRHQEQTQQQKIKADPEDHPEERADAGE